VVRAYTGALLIGALTSKKKEIASGESLEENDLMQSLLD
jgi:hypothetical protein